MFASRLVVLLTLVLLLAGCGSSETTSTPARSPNTSAGPAQTSSASAAPVESASGLPASATPRPWLTYASKRFHYSLKHPPDWVVTPGTTKLPDTFDNNQAFIYASRTTVSGAVSLGLTVTFETNYLKSHYKAKLRTSANLTAAGWPAKLLTFKATRDGRAYYIQELILAKGSAAYFLVWWSDPGHVSADRALFRRIFLTFRRT